MSGEKRGDFGTEIVRHIAEEVNGNSGRKVVVMGTKFPTFLFPYTVIIHENMGTIMYNCMERTF